MKSYKQINFASTNYEETEQLQNPSKFLKNSKIFYGAKLYL